MARFFLKIFFPILGTAAINRRKRLGERDLDKNRCGYFLSGNAIQEVLQIVLFTLAVKMLGGQGRAIG